MEKWLESVYSDGSKMFVSSPSPYIGESVTVKIRMYKDAPVDHVLLRTVPNGAESLTEAVIADVVDGLVYYQASFCFCEPRMNYQFYIVSGDTIYYYTQWGITTYIPDHTYDFVLMSDYEAPEWVRNQVFYQIFPERFANGRPDISVKDNEYENKGYSTIAVKDWNSYPMSYEEGHALDFYGGDLYGIKDKIPYLKELGVTAIYLNPIFTAPTTHKYDCSDYFHVDPHFGGDEALAELSHALHENGMKLILDISINHTGTSHVWFKEGRKEYYFFDENGDYKGWFDNKDLPVLNYQSKALREIVYKGDDSVLRKWLKPPYNIDGWRFDVADVFARNDKVQLSRELWPEIRKAIRQENPKAYILGEDWGDCGVYLQGKDWDSPMNYFGFGRPIRQFVGQPDLFNMRNPILKNVNYHMSAEDFVGRVREHLAKLPFIIWQNQFNLFDSHDVSRLMHEDVNPGDLRGAIIMQFVFIGAPSIYYGDEAQIEGFTHADAGFRAPMPWGSGFEKNSMYITYRELCHLKKKSKALCEGGMKFIYAQNDIVVLARFYEDDIILAVMSVSDEEQCISVPVGSVGITEDYIIEDYLGEEVSYKFVGEHLARIKVPAHQAYLLVAARK